MTNFNKKCWILMTYAIKDNDKFYPQLFLEQAFLES